ncbi:hypothetical protein [Dictyobacter vulcani]|uniref:hypothetical protein n=1 Tax=Dictyobacter vulcani TaxID=2607529 RepID=UPI00124F8326|nr:hypothetical protein [Dictyobacter vulcani]
MDQPRARASFKRDEQAKLLLQGVLLWGREVMHVFDQGFASSFWLGLLVAFSLRFVLRWKKDYQLVDEQGQRRAAWKIARGKRGWQQRLVWDCRRHQWVMASILALPVTHPDHREQPLWLVVARRKGGLPWYLLTAEPIANADDAWRIMFAYARRWQIELTWKENKSELAFQSPVCGSGNHGKNSCCWQHWRTHFCSPCWRRFTRSCAAGCCAATVIERVAIADRLMLPLRGCAWR